MIALLDLPDLGKVSTVPVSRYLFRTPLTPVLETPLGVHDLLNRLPSHVHSDDPVLVGGGQVGGLFGLKTKFSFSVKNLLQSLKTIEEADLEDLVDDVHMEALDEVEIDRIDQYHR